jgi:hypothetical protein
MMLPRMSPNQTLQYSLELEKAFGNQVQDAETFFRDKKCIQPKNITRYDQYLREFTQSLLYEKNVVILQVLRNFMLQTEKGFPKLKNINGEAHSLYVQNETVSLYKTLKETNQLPSIFFCFSKKTTEKLALELCKSQGMDVSKCTYLKHFEKLHKQNVYRYWFLSTPPAYNYQLQ